MGMWWWQTIVCSLCGCCVAFVSGRERALSYIVWIREFKAKETHFDFVLLFYDFFCSFCSFVRSTQHQSAVCSGYASDSVHSQTHAPVRLLLGLLISFINWKKFAAADTMKTNLWKNSKPSSEWSESATRVNRIYLLTTFCDPLSTYPFQSIFDATTTEKRQQENKNRWN